MPKPTFFNLPQKKQDKIIEAGFYEFGNNRYTDVKLNHLIKRAGIPKGSFYQYFKGKEDIYLYILTLIGQKKALYLSPKLRNPDNLDFFTMLRELFMSGIEFVRNEPEIAKISEHFFKDMHSDALGKLDIPYEMYVNPFIAFIEKGIANGDIRDDVDVRFTAKFIQALNLSIVDSLDEFFEHDDTENFEYAVEKLIDFLKNGIGIEN
jgi:AcrR family transcriptional regulator